MDDALVSFNRHTICLAGGAGLYVGTYALLLMRWNGRTLTGDGPSFLDCLPFLVALVVLGILFAAPATVRQNKGRRSLVLAAMGCSLASAALVLAMGLDAQPTVALAITLGLQGCHAALFSFFQGLAFASLDKERAEHTVVGAIFVAFCLYGAGMLVSPGAVGFSLLAVLQTVACLPFLLGQHSPPITSREPVTANHDLLIPLLGSRLSFGVALGVAFGIALFLDSTSPVVSPAWTVLLSLAAAVLLVLRKNHAGRVAASLRVAPLVIAGALTIPLIGTTDISRLITLIAPTAIFVSWFALSSVQLSDIKERLGWDESRLALTERTALFAGWTLALLATFILLSSPSLTATKSLWSGVVTAVLYLVLIVACSMMAGLIERKDKARTLHAALKLSENQHTIIYDEITATFDLTPREREVFELMAKGYSRPLICEKLVIAESTARSHTKHIYQKLGIHAREELYRIVEAREQRFSSEKSNF